MLDGAAVLATTIVDENGVWQVDVVIPKAGLYVLTISQTDAAGKELATPAEFTVIVAESPLGGAVRPGAATVRPGTVVRGRAPAGMNVYLSAGDREIGMTKAGPDGTWEFVLPADLERTTEALDNKWWTPGAGW